MKSNQPLIISFLFHICLYLLALLSPGENLLKSVSQPIDVVYQNETKKRQIVMDPNQQKLENSLKKLAEQTDRLSRITQRVKEQTIASQIGKTQNQARADIQKYLPRGAQKEFREKSFNDIDPSAPSITKPLPTENSQVGNNTQLSDSSIAEYIPDVRMGGFTALNTDQFLHYTFYARTNEQIRSRWVSLISEFLERTPQFEINRLALKIQSTQIEVILNPKGDFVKALIHQQAENSGLDKSAITAFRIASPLNNPPAEMIESDGYIHLYYSFYVQFRPRYIASGSK